ncbi:unnamed protein product [Darwinula stevensoni]|uniref:Uncharacterized protein n=1 Tax=Darwinula stevensoni TaxID=69355 RepID=A0A7R9A4G3_9CRUS|nr:unnamed protein product [Darwinula stevensoni]CAG0893552.1 unnamed protein product [Darwinula stevensoni]
MKLALGLLGLACLAFMAEEAAAVALGLLEDEHLHSADADFPFHPLFGQKHGIQHSDQPPSVWSIKLGLSSCLFFFLPSPVTHSHSHYLRAFNKQINVNFFVWVLFGLLHLVAFSKTGASPIGPVRVVVGKGPVPIAPPFRPFHSFRLFSPYRNTFSPIFPFLSKGITVQANVPEYSNPESFGVSSPRQYGALNWG